MSSTTQLLIVSALSYQPVWSRNRPELSPSLRRPKTSPSPRFPGIIDAGAKWKLVWQGNENADGIVGFKERSAVRAGADQSCQHARQERQVFRLPDRTATAPARSPSVRRARIIVDERTCTDPGGHMGAKPADCTEPTGVAALTPERKVLGE